MLLSSPYKGSGGATTHQGPLSIGPSDTEGEGKRSPGTSTTTTGGPEAAVLGVKPAAPTVEPPPHSSSGSTAVSSHEFNAEQGSVKMVPKSEPKDRDTMKKALKKALRDRDEASKKLLPASQAPTVGPQGLPQQQALYGAAPAAEGSSPREIESLNLKFERALIDVQLLRKQNVELSRKYETTVKDIEFYRKQERSTYNNIHSLRQQYDEMVVEKRKLENEVSSLQKTLEEDRKEMADLRHQQEESLSHGGSGEAMNQLYLTTFRKYDALKDEYDSLRKRYSDVAASHSSNISRLDLAQEEIARLKKQSDEVSREKNCLKQQCTEAIRQWDTALRDKNKLQEELLKVRERNEELVKEMNSHLVQSQNLNKEYKRLQSERNAAMREYSLVMSERDTVHKEMDKLQEELSVANRKANAVEKCTVDSAKERESLQLELETLKREIASSLHERDKALRECNDLREHFGASNEEAKDWGDSIPKDYETYKQEREYKLKESCDPRTSSLEMYSKAQKERLENLDQANQEIDRLRKNMETFQSDLEEAKREAEVSKRRRDWAFSERDKIVLERESIRAHCDKLRHERDRAVSDLADALRDSDDMMKQRNEAAKELKELKEKLDSEREKVVSVRANESARNASRDSAIDTDMHEWEIETMHLQVGAMHSERDLGFEVRGGVDDPHYGGNDGALYVSAISSESPFEGKLKLHDHLIRINGVECHRTTPITVYNAILKSGGWVQLTIRRRRGGVSRTLHTTHLHCPNQVHHGVVLQAGLYIASILPGSAAARDGNLAVGDRLISVNGKSVDSFLGRDDVQSILNSSGEMLQLTTMKSVGSSSISAPLSSSSSGHNMAEDDRMAVVTSSPSKETLASSGGGRSSKDFGFKFKSGDENKRLGSSSERVAYKVTKPQEEKSSSGGPWGQIKNIVRPRHSKERPDSRASADKDDQSKKKDKEEKERESAIAQLDSILNSYKYKTSPRSSTTANSTNTSKRPKKKDKENTCGTWPKYRGAGFFNFGDVNIGTIKPFSATRKERPPLSMYIPTLSSNSKLFPSTEYPKSEVVRRSPNIKKYLPGARNTISTPTALAFGHHKVLDSDQVNHQVNHHHSHPFAISNDIYANTQSVYAAIPVRMSSFDRKEALEKDLKDSHGSSGDTSIDFSVRSGNVGKEELEYYVKKNLGGVKYAPSDSESTSSLHLQPCGGGSLPPVYSARPSPLHHLGERIPSNSRLPLPPHSGLYSPPPSGAIRVSPFVPYAPLSFHHQHTHTHTITTTLPSYASPSYSTPPLPIIGNSPHHYLSPSRSGESIISSPGPDRDLRDIRGFYESQLASSPTSGFFHPISPSIEVGGTRRLIHPHHPHPPHGTRVSSDEPPPHILTGPPSYNDYQRSIATMPRKRDDQRVRIPSSSSVSSARTSRLGDTSDHRDRDSLHLERGSPISSGFPITQISHSVRHHSSQSLPYKKAQPGDIRNIYIEKDADPLGIQIRCLGNGGVFVASVTRKSIADFVGLSIGDQLLEVCGINLRSATKELASTVLSQCGNSVTMLVQFNPEKYHDSVGWDESSSAGSIIIGSRSGTPTPQNSPNASRSSAMLSDGDLGEESGDEAPQSATSTLRAPLERENGPHDIVDSSSLPPSARSTLTRSQAAHVLGALSRQDTLSRRNNNVGSNKDQGELVTAVAPSSPCSDGHSTQGREMNASEPRTLYVSMDKCHNLGVQMVGGNALGIYIHSVSPESPAAKSDLRVGDRILEYNDVDLRHATAEQAACELSKPADNIRMLVQWNFQTYSEIRDQPGDSFYIRALFNRHEQSDPMDLVFSKGDILYVDNTLFNNILGRWRAWLVNEDGHKRLWGTIPSKDKMEEEMASQRLPGELQMDTGRRGSTTARRSFFRRKKHSRSSSRDSRELASFSDASLSSCPEVPSNPDEVSIPVAYLTVERLDYLVRRPVVLVGPLWELVSEKLTHDFPHKFARCAPETHFGGSQMDLEAAAQNGSVVDYRRRGNHFEATFVSQVKEICDKNCHGILDVSLASVSRLHRHAIYPIVLVLKFKHHKHIRDISDAHLATCERLSQKEAKEMFDLTNKIDHDYKHLISAEIAAGVNVSYICAQIKAIVDSEQAKTLWVPTEPL